MKTLQLDKEQMRSLGYRAVDMLVEHFDALPVKPATRNATRADLAALREPLPEYPTDAVELLSRLEADVFSRIMHVDHPRFFAFVPSPSNYVSVIANLLATGHNVFAGTWLESSAAGEIELVALDWIRRMCGLPERWGGLFTSGGSSANLTALAAARHVQGVDPRRAMVYFSDQTHSSVRRALRVLGIRDNQIRELKSDAQLRLPSESVRAAIRRDRENGLAPLALVANAGTTNTGAVDPLAELAELAQAEHVWLHVDAAYGGAAMLTAEGRSLLAGLGGAHSIALDPHKWLFQPFDTGCLLVRDPKLLEQTFRVLPAYLQDLDCREGEVNFCDRGIELTRPFRALKVWMTLKAFGRRALAEAVQHGIDLARIAETELRAMPGWEIVTPAQLGVVTFRFRPEGVGEKQTDAANRRLPRAVIDDGFAMISTTEVFGRPVARMCTINPRTTKDDVRQTLAKLNALAVPLADQARTRSQLPERPAPDAGGKRNNPT